MFYSTTERARGYPVSKRISRASVPPEVLRSLRESYALANRHAADLVKAYGRNPLTLIDLIGEIERGADRANQIAMSANAKAAANARSDPT